MDVKPKSERDSPPRFKTESTSTPSTPTPRPSGPQLIGHLARAEEDAMKTFFELSDNVYQYKTLGRSRQADEGLTCDCTFEPGVDDTFVACGDGSDCINRLTQVECLEDDCRCRSHCQNQRFQRKQYAPFHIVKTEMKGFGLRAATDLSKDTFIYEYIGEVVSHPSFAKRMREYAEEGIRHFYFMMLQKDEFIDATKKGGVGRFANHSCNPNCYVAKWTVGLKVRMGIFSKRRIKKDEELTFNYNVDRYGHDAQPCYCGEARCVGFIGGKTQTDIAAMDDIVLDALGISEDVELLNLKGSKKKKGKKLDEDFVPILKPLTEKDVPKVIQAIRQTSNRKLLMKLLTRVKCTDDQSALRQIMRLRGFSLMTTVLEDHATDLELCTLVLESLPNWPLITRNKVEDSKIEVPVRALGQSGSDRLKELSENLLKYWATLELAYRIPKRVSRPDENGEETKTVTFLEPEDVEEVRPTKRIRFGEQDIETPVLSIKPLGRSERTLTVASVSKATSAPPTPLAEVRSTKPTKQDLAAIIAAATAAASMTPVKPVSSTSNGHSDSAKKRSKESSSKSKGNKEKQLLKLVGAVVVKSMSKYQSQFEHNIFKKYAEQITHIIAEKEKKSSSYEAAKLDALSEDKKQKIKKFVKDYIGKILRRRKDKSKSKSSRHEDKPPKAENLEEPFTTTSKGSFSPNDSIDGVAAPDGDDNDDIEYGDHQMDGDIEQLEKSATIGGKDVDEDPWEIDRHSETMSVDGKADA